MSLEAQPEEIQAVPIRHYGRWLAAALILAVVVWLGAAAANSHAVSMAAVRRYLFNPVILRGLRNTVILAVLAQVVGIALGIIAALMRRSVNPVLSVTSWLYIWLFRGTPVLVQLIFWYSAVPLAFKHLTIAVPFTHLTLYSTRMVSFMTSFKAALIGLSLNEGAYMAEIVRAGITSVDEGQVEAAQALGMRAGLTMRRIVLPQAMRVIIPPTGNEFISMLKTSSLASVILYPELLRAATDIYSVNFLTLELLIVASIWYLVLTSIATFGQYYIERRYARGSTRELPPTPLQKLRANLLRIRPSPSEAPR